MDRDLWCRQLFESIDAKRTQEFVAFLAPDAVFRFGSAAPVHGVAAIAAAVERFFASITALSHQVLDLWEPTGHVICRGEVTYRRLDGKVVQIPFCDVIKIRAEKIVRYDIYLDPTPLG